MKILAPDGDEEEDGESEEEGVGLLEEGLAEELPPEGLQAAKTRVRVEMNRARFFIGVFSLCGREKRFAAIFRTM